jgi:hypothetical protein
MPGPQGVPRADIIALLQEGHANNYIGRTLRTSPQRVGRIRAELGLPVYRPGSGLTLEQKWAAFARPAHGGHMQWFGGMRCGTANLVYQGSNYSARRVAFQIGHGREPVGRVLPSCGHDWCVAPEHATDGPMRRADAVYPAIFGSAA